MAAFNISAQMLFFMQGLFVLLILLVFFIPSFPEIRLHEFLTCAYNFFLQKYKNLL